jgi:hypothetical protein
MEYLDKPNLDETPQAHPAYWRGKSRGINDILKIVSDVMLGKDNGTGANNHKDIENMRRALLTWRDEINNSSATNKKK